MKRILVACAVGLLFVGCRSKDYDREDRKIGQAQPVPGAYDRDTQQAVNDPICGMEIDPVCALMADHEGTTYYFCSEECFCIFQENPAAYAQAQVTNEVD